jgi:hypothetical protein
MPAEGEMQSLVTPMWAFRDFSERLFTSSRARISAGGGLECCKKSVNVVCREVRAKP